MTVNNFKKANFNIEIEDFNNLFLKGIDPDNFLPTYFGIWINKSGLSIVTITGFRFVHYEHFNTTDVRTEFRIRDFLIKNINVHNIIKKEFKEQIKNVDLILEI